MANTSIKSVSFLARVLTRFGCAFLLLGLVLSSSAQADLIYAVRVNALNAAGTSNYRTGDNSYSNYNCSTNDDSKTVQWVTQDNNKPYTVTDDTIPIMLFDLGTVRTINALRIAPYSATGNDVKAMTVEFYDSPAINATPITTQTFTGIPQSLTTLSLTTPTNARFVKITMTENHGGDRYGVGNLMFDVVSDGKPTSSSVNVASYKSWPVSNLYDSSASTQWVTNTSTGGGYYNPEVGNPDPVLTFNYSSPQTITGIGVNGYSVASNSLKDFNLTFYDASGTQISVADPTQYSFTMAHTSTAVRDEFTFPAVENVSKIEMTLTSNNYVEGSGGGDRVGLSEVSFFVPVELDAPTTPAVYNGRYSTDSTIVRPTSAQFLNPAGARVSDQPLTKLFDGKTDSSGVWYSIATKVGSTTLSDYFTVGFTPVIELTMPEQAAFDSFSVWGYYNGGNQMSDFTLELYDSAGKLVYADEYFIDQYINSNNGNYATFTFDGDTYAFKTAVLTVLDNGYGIYPGVGGGDRVGFAEIAFYQVPQEPYYYANTSDISASNWTIDGSVKKGVIFTEGASTATFANPVIFNSDGTIEIGSGKNLTLSGVVSGNGAVTKTGAGTLTMTKPNTYGGGTMISEGTVKLTEAGTLGSGSVTVNDNAALEFAQNSNQTISNDITSYGSVSKTGTGTVTLSGYNSYYGDTTISGGTLLVPTGGHFTSSQVTVTTGGTFQTGVNLEDVPFSIEGGTFAIGDTSTSSEITISSLTLNGGTISFDFNDSSRVNSNGYLIDTDWLYVTSSASLISGYIDLTFNSSSAEDWWNVLNASGNGLYLIEGAIQNIEGFNNNNNVKVTVNGTLSNRWALTAESNAILLWAVEGSDDPDPGPGPGPEPGSAWYNADSTDIGLQWTIDGTTKEGAILNSGSNYSVMQSNSVEMTSNGGKIQVGANYNLTLSGGLSGSAPLEKTDAGKLTITTANSDFTGDTTVSGGTLELTGAGTLGSSTINVGAGATMLYTNTVPHNTTALTYNINGGTLEFYNDTTTTATHNADIAICSGLSGQDVTINGTGGTLLIDGGGCVAALNSNASTVTFALDANSTIYVKSGYFVNGGYATQNWDNNQATLHIGATGKVELWDGKQMKVGGLIGETGAQLLETKAGNGISIGNGTTSNQNFVYNGTIALNGKTLTKVGDGTQVLNGAISNAKISSNAGTLVLGVSGNEINIGTNSLVKTNGGAVRVDGNIVVNTSYLSAGGDWTGNGNITVNSGTMRIYGTFSYPKGITLNGGTLFNDGDSDDSATGKGVINSPVIVNSASKVQCGWSSSKSGELTLAGGLYGNGNLTVNSDSNMGWINITGTGDYGGSLILKGKVRIGGSGKNIGTAAEPASAAPYIGSKEIQMDGGQLHNYDAYLTFPNDLNFTATSTFMAGWNKDITLTGNVKGSGNFVVASDSGWVIAKTKSDGSFTGTVQTNWGSATSYGKLRLEADQPFGPNAGRANIYGQLDMNGYSQAFKGITSDVDSSTSTQKGTIYNNTNTLSTLTLNITGADNSYEGVINGNIELIVNSDGAGKQTFKNKGSSFTGNVVINGGTVATTLNHNNYTTTSLGAFSTPGGRTITINQGAELAFGTNDTLGGCTLSQYNNDSVRLIVNGGKLSGTNNNPLCNATFQNGAEVYGNNNRDIWRSFWLMGTNTVSFAGNGSTPEQPVNFNGAEGVIFVLDTATLNVDDITKSSAADLVVNVKLGNKSESVVTNNSLTKTGAGTVRLTAANEYTGATTVSAGALALASTGSLVSDVTVAAGASFIDAAPTITSNVTLNGGSLVIGEATDSTQIAIGDLAVDGGSIFFDFNNSATATDYDRLTVNAATFTTGTISVAFNKGDQTDWWNNNTENGYVLIETTSLNANLDNIQLLVNSATTDAWYLDTVGTSIVLKNQAVEPPPQTDYYVVNSDDIEASTWTIDGTNKLGITYTDGDDAATFNGEVKMNASAPNGTVEVGDGKNLTLSGKVSGEGQMEKTGEGTLTLANTNDNFTGVTKVSDGTLALTATDAISNSSSVENNGAITMGANQSLNNLSGNGTIDNGGSDLTLNNAAATEFSGVISGDGDLVKTGAETLTLSGDNTYAGDTTVSKGKLALTGDAVKANSSIEIAENATLEYNVPTGEKSLEFTSENNKSVTGNKGNVIKTGAGTLKILATDGLFESNRFDVEAGELDFKGTYHGNLEVKPGTTFSPGNSVGDLTVYGNVTIDPRATGLFEFSAYKEDPTQQQFDTLTVNDGAFVIDENSIIKLFFEGGNEDAKLWAAEGSEYKLVSDEDFDSEIPKLGNYQDWFDLVGGTDGLYLVGLYVPGTDPEPGSGVPEPSTWALLILGAAGLLFWRKRKNA